MNLKLSFIEVTYTVLLLVLWYGILPIAIAMAVIQLNNPLLAFGGTGMGVLFGVAVSKIFIKNDSKAKSILVGLMYIVLVITVCVFEYTTSFINISLKFIVSNIN